MYLILAIVAISTIVFIVAAVNGYYPVPQGHVVLIERFGQYQRTLSSGINFIIPFIDQPRTFADWGTTANKSQVLMELAEQHTDTAPRAAMTKDNVEVDVDAAVYWQVIDPVRARYEVDRLPAAILDMALNVLRTAIGSVTLDQALTERAKLNQYLLVQLTKTCDKWGTKIIRVEIQTLRPSGGGAGEALIKEMSAERERRAAILIATGEKDAEVLRATADREAMILRAQGHAQATAIRTAADIDRFKRFSELLGQEKGFQAATAWRYFETLSEMAHDPALKIFLPGNSNGMVPFADFFTNMETSQSVRPKEIDRESANWPPTRNSTHEINGNG